MGLAAKNAKKTWPMVRLGDLCIVQRGVRVTRKDLDDNGKYNVYQNSLKPLGKYNSFNCEARNPFMIMALAAGEPGFSEEPFWAADDCTYFKDLKGLDNQYLYFLLSVNKDELKRNVKQTTIPRLSNKFLESLEFSLPPLSVQREIVARLEKELGEADALAAKFKGIAENADAEFKAELDETFKNVEGEKVRLGHVCEIKRGRVINKKYLEAHKGMYPVYSSQTLHDGIFGYIDTFDFEGEFLTWTTDGANAGSVFYHNGKFSITNVCGLLKIRDRGMDARWLLHYLTLNAKSYVNKSLGNPKLMSNVVANIPMVVPALTTQRTIVARLDTMRERCDKLKAAAERGLRAAEDLRKAILAEAFEQ